MARLQQIAWLVLALVLGAGRSYAQSADDVARSRTHFEAGRALYNLGNYTDAIREFSAGYQNAPKPLFLVNLGQAYRKLNDLEHARDMYKKFLSEAPSNDPDREQVKQILTDLDQQIAARPPPVAPTPAPVAQPAPEAAVAVVAQPVAPPKKSFARRHWWIFPVAGVVLGAVAVGIYFGVRPASQIDCGAATLGCIDTMSPR